MTTMTAAAPPRPITLITGTDDLLVSRAISAVVGAARAADPMAEVNDYAAGQFSADEVLTLNNPSLFGGWRVVVVRGVQDLPEEVAAALARLRAGARARAGGGAHGDGSPLCLGERAAQAEDPRGQSCADHATRGSAPSSLPTRPAGTGAGSPTTPPRLLVEAVGSDLGAIAGAVEQLMAGIGPRGLINDDAVAQLFRGRAETTGFNIADAVLNGELERGLTLLRQSLEVGTPPVFIPSALARGLREIAKVSAARERRGQSRAELAKALGMPDWKLDRAQKLARTGQSRRCARRSSPSPRPTKA